MSFHSYVRWNIWVLANPAEHCWTSWWKGARVEIWIPAFKSCREAGSQYSRPRCQMRQHTLKVSVPLPLLSRPLRILEDGHLLGWKTLPESLDFSFTGTLMTSEMPHFQDIFSPSLLGKVYAEMKRKKNGGCGCSASWFLGPVSWSLQHWGG